MRELFITLTTSLLMLASGCVRKEEPLPNDLQTTLGKADSIIATNVSGRHVSISSSDVPAIVQAMQTGTHNSEIGYQADPTWTVQFYSGTNLLFSTLFQDGIFYAQGREFRSKKPVLRGMQHMLDSYE